jgi:peroxiredoxin
VSEAKKPCKAQSGAPAHTGAAGKPALQARPRAEAFAEATTGTGPLTARLIAFAENSSLLQPEIYAAYSRLVQRLEALRAAQVGPKVGEPMPDFILPDQQGQLVSLEALCRNGPVVLSFNRGHWCPYCQIELRALAAAHGEVRRLGGDIVSIVPERAQFSKKLAADHGIPFRVLSDVDLGYALSLGFVYWIGAEIKAIYDAVGVDLANYHGNGNYFLPIAATFVVGADGTIVDRHVDPDYRLRMNIDRMLAALERLSKR